MILIRLMLTLVTLNLLNASTVNHIQEYLCEENIARAHSCNLKIDKLTAIRDYLEVGGNVFLQASLACFAVGNAEWFKSSSFGSINLTFFGSVAAVTQAGCFTIAKFFDSEITKTESLVKELLADQKDSYKLKSA